MNEGADSGTFYIYSDDGYLPGVGVFTSEELADFERGRSEWNKWQERFRELHREQMQHDAQHRQDEHDRKMFASTRDRSCALSFLAAQSTATWPLLS